jgi:GntR family transcriptional regulator, negative regulator for fad regulon and positive regulator of fabA
MEEWPAPLRPLAHASQALVTAILEGDFPPGSTLPAERELSVRLGVTRPTLREALRRLESEGWLQIQQGKPTRVKDFWQEGGLHVLSTLVRHSKELPADFVPHLLEVRLALAPAYTRAAVENNPDQVAKCLAPFQDLEDQPVKFATLDWLLHSSLTRLSGNPIYSLILNGFAGFYEQMAVKYFANPTARRASRKYYAALGRAAADRDPLQAEQLTRQAMEESIRHWRDSRPAAPTGPVRPEAAAQDHSP